MSSELSRVETYNRNRKKNQSKKPPLSPDEELKTKSSKIRREEKKSTAAPTLSRVRSMKERKGVAEPARGESEPRASHSADSSQTYRSRSERYKNGHDGKAGTEEDIHSAPARTETYGSHRNVISKYFTNSLFFLFLVLTAFLVYWGVKGAPPLEDLW
ncbi:hypothetical protein GRF59_14100 [Paenibacillus sp. HJL G12]|uniref:Uncharacterized protein n=1 Tax=Paenibacillus dendrobii TaxID=2691084 RepID=A0A7X3IIT2_9BACL|nr:hypothetical protein [Paenibacillus dendrobii]MWV44748.1 hypothetical protein [Paenibacillus dendrobii]